MMKYDWIKPLPMIAIAVLVIGGCKSEMQGQSGGSSAPPSGGMPPPGGGMPPPPPSGGASGGGSSGGESSPSGGSSGGESSPSGGSQSPSGGSSGGQSGSGSSGGGMPMPLPGGGEQGGAGDPGSSGEVGSVPGSDAGVPPPPSQRGGGGAEGDAAAASEGDAGGDSDSDGDGDSQSDCGDTGALPGGVGGMGQAGECLGGGGAAASADAAAAGGGSAGGGAAGGDEAVAGTGGAGSVGEFPEESAEERAARLGKELDESIGGFDEVLMEEQQEIAAVGRNTEGFGEGASGSGGISLGEQAGGRGGSITVANTGIERKSPTDGLTEQEIQERTPEDLVTMVDDDIIARQLREAALAEEDPALRERLWEEYRKYKGR